MELLNRFRYTAEQAYYSQAQWLDVDKPQNNPLFGVIDQKKKMTEKYRNQEWSTCSYEYQSSKRLC